MTELSIVPECYVDTKVAEILGQATRKYNHQHGCGDVANQLRNKLKNRIALGIIDEDKNKGVVAKYFTEFETIKEENNLILKRHRERKHYLILICPEVEQWLFTDSKTVGIVLTEFDLPHDLIGLKQITKIQGIDKNMGFYRFIKKLLLAKAPSVTTLQNWIEHFKSDKLDLM
jgi:hypothetical protein